MHVANFTSEALICNQKPEHYQHPRAVLCPILVTAAFSDVTA